MARAIKASFILFFTCIFSLGDMCMIPSDKLNPRTARASSDGATLWYDCKDLLVLGKGWTDTELFYDRLPANAKGKAPGDDYALGRNSAGISVHFTTDAPAIQVRWALTSDALALPHMPATGVSGIDVYAKDKTQGWRFVGNGRPLSTSNSALFNLPPAEEYLVYLPLYNGTKSIEIGVPKDKFVAKPKLTAEKQGKPVVFYGTSIDQGACASRPGMSALNIVGRQLDKEVINLGFNGSGRMEPAMADLLAELDPSVYVIDGLWNMTLEQVSERAETFVAKLRAAHPATPILLAEDCHYQDKSPTPKGALLRDVYKKLKNAGDKNLYFLDNQGMNGSDGEGTVDGCHPNDLGMMRQATAFSQALKPLLAESEKTDKKSGKSISIDDANIALSPYVWKRSGTGSEARAEATMPGAYIKAVFNGSTAVRLLIDGTANAECPAEAMPVVDYSVDQGAFQTVQLTKSGEVYSLLLAGSLDATKEHRMEVYFRAATLGLDRWRSPKSRLRIAGIELDSSGTLLSVPLRPKRAIGFGDSITEGVCAEGLCPYYSNLKMNNARVTWFPLVAAALNCEYGQLGTGGQGMVKPIEIPPLPQTWGQYDATASRLTNGLLVPEPDYVFCAMGTNDYQGAADNIALMPIDEDYAKLLESVRKACPHAAIFCVVPPLGWHAKEIADAVAVRKKAGDGNVYLIDTATLKDQFGLKGATQLAEDGVHPSVYGNAMLGALIAAEAGKALSQQKEQK